MATHSENPEWKGEVAISLPFLIIKEDGQWKRLEHNTMETRTLVYLVNHPVFTFWDYGSKRIKSQHTAEECFETKQPGFQGFVCYSHITRKEYDQWPQRVPFIYLKGWGLHELTVLIKNTRSKMVYSPEKVERLDHFISYVPVGLNIVARGAGGDVWVGWLWLRRPVLTWQCWYSTPWDQKG